MKNSNEEELKREKRSLKGKIERRETAIAFAQKDIRDYRTRLRLIEEQLREFQVSKALDRI
jgi:molecular chaperone GrpE (heat shock protein)